MSNVTPPGWRPPLWRVLAFDLLSVAGALILLAGLITLVLAQGFGQIPLYFGRIIFAESEIDFITLATLIILAVTVPILVQRISYLRSILNAGVTAPGQISRIQVTPFEFRVEYSFIYQQRSLRGITNIRRSRQRERRITLKPGGWVTIRVHQHLPDRSLLQDLYR